MDEFRLGLSGCAGGLETISTSGLLALAEWVEALGFDSVWLNEEHFQGGDLDVEGRRCLSPLILAAAFLARTSRLRVGFSVLLMALHHPLRLAEDLATLDVVSNGRLDFGVSRGANPRYLSAYGVSAGMADEKNFGERLDFLLRAWSDAPVESGRGPISVQPKPVQQPHPPLYIGTYTENTAAWAAKRGWSIICHGIANMASQRRILDAFASEGGDVTAVPFGRFVYVSESDESARKEVWPTILKLTNRLRNLLISGRNKIIAERDLDPEIFYREMVIAGSPQSCVDQINALRADIGISYLNALAAFFGFLPLDHLQRSLRLLAAEVRPKIRK